eukprot:783369-Rhodomonas_salina.5
MRLESKRDEGGTTAGWGVGMARARWARRTAPWKSTPRRTFNAPHASSASCSHRSRQCTGAACSAGAASGARLQSIL